MITIIIILKDILYHDQNIYSKDEIFEILEMINDGNKLSGGLVKIWLIIVIIIIIIINHYL